MDDDDEAELELTAIRGERRDALRELRRLTERPVGELNGLIGNLPAVLYRGSRDEVLALLSSATDLLQLQALGRNGMPFGAPSRRPGPHREERIEVSRHDGGVRFAVDEVDPATEPRSTKPESERWRELTDGVVLHQGASRDLVEPGSAHTPLASAVQLAFDEHRPLRLTPDAVWLTIAAGFAQHVNARPETLRERFVRHEGRKTLEVVWQDSWNLAAQDLAAAVAEDMGAGHQRLFQCDFSTTTPLDRLASDVVFLGAFRRYYDYLLIGICGIPHIDLLGTVEDWQKIRDRIEVLAEYEAEPWVASLRPLADEWVTTATGCPDIAFWQAIYKPQQAYEEDVATGWITQLYPYLERETANPSIGTGGPHTGYAYEPLQLSKLPGGVVSAPVRTDLGGSYDFFGGLIGVTQDAEGVLQPVSSWAVIERPYARVLDRLEKEHELRPAAKVDVNQPLAVPKALLELYDRGAGGSLHKGRWTLRRPNELEEFFGEPAEGSDDEVDARVNATVFADLADGRRVAALGRESGSLFELDWWILVLPPTGPVPLDAPVVAKGFQEFLEAVLGEEDEPYFDAPDYVRDSVARDALGDD